jgi:predicted AlkP superfamily pyrophosphatase or phosphodiesterase
MRLILALLLAITIGGCATTPAPRTAATEARAPVTILVSIDGFRPDYLDRGVTPALSRLAAQGVLAAMRPSFPSKTFPNHYAIVTGLRPDRNGIVANKMEDARRPGETFTMATEDPFWWNEATPIWVDAEKAGVRTATMFWPGSNVDFEGARPQDWQQYNEAVTGTQRVDAVIDWLRRPAAIRPKLLTLYFDTVDTAGHDFGPDDARTTAAIADVDAKIAMLVDGLAALHQPANLVIVADHGMAATSIERTVMIDTIATPGDYRVVESGPYAALAAVPGREAALEARLLGKHPHATCWRKAEIPARFHYGRNPRVPPYLCLADIGWLLIDKLPKTLFKGNHGYDHEAPEMAALFIASGPGIARGRTLPTFDNVAVYALLRDLTGMPPATGKDGDDAPFREILANPRPRSP